MTRILILTDYRGTFYSTARTQHGLCTMDVDRITAYLAGAGLAPEVIRLADLDLSDDLRGVPVLYTSSEDRGLSYKSWIEDLVLALETRGAQVLPGYRYLRAHHNKVMMEALRTHLFPADARRLDTRSFGTYEELAEATLDGPWPKVLSLPTAPAPSSWPAPPTERNCCAPPAPSAAPTTTRSPFASTADGCFAAPTTRARCTDRSSWCRR